MTSPASGVVEFAIPGILQVRTHDAGAPDLVAVGRDMGPPRGGAEDESPLLVVRFVDRLPEPPGVQVFGRKGRPVAHVSQGDRWGEAVVTCLRGLNRIPMLSAAVDLAALARGWVPLHGSAWVEADGTGVLATGGARSGKTGALLAALEAGATLVGDDRILLSGDGRSMVGLGRPIEVKDWHMAQLTIPALGPRGVRRALSRATSRFALGRLRGLLSAEVDPRSFSSGGQSLDAGRPDVLVLLEPHPHPSVVAVPADSQTVAHRLASQVEGEIMSGLATHLPLPQSSPNHAWAGLDRIPDIAKANLLVATGELRSYVVRHPYRGPLKELGEAIAGVRS